MARSRLCALASLVGAAALLTTVVGVANPGIICGVSEQAEQFVAAAYLKPLGLENAPCVTSIAGHANPFSARMVQLDVQRSGQSESPDTPVAIHVVFFVRGHQLVGVAAGGEALESSGPVPEEVRRARRTAGLAALRALFGWKRIESTTVVPETQREHVVFSTTDPKRWPVDRSADFDPKTGFLRGAGRL